jgi:hypothetical protein
MELMKEFTIIDSFPDSLVSDIENTFNEYEFPWYFRMGTSYNEDMSFFGKTIVQDENTKDSPQFVHQHFSNGQTVSPTFESLIRPVLYILEMQGVKIKGLVRAKSNLMLKEEFFPDGKYNIAHADIREELAEGNFWTFLYYVNDADSPTMFFDRLLTSEEDEDVVHPPLSVVHQQTPKGGSGILFKANRFHSSVPPKTTDRRMVINIVVELEDEEPQD